jgi:hypothetical protein
MTDHQQDDRRGDDHGITRRVALGSGLAAAVGAGVMSTSASAGPLAARGAKTPKAANVGRVTVFNCFNEPIRNLAVGGHAVGTIDGWSDGRAGRPPRYTPASLTVARSRNPEAETFGVGDNPVIIPWESFTGSTYIKIPDPTRSPISLEDDLLLFVGTNQVTMLTTRGIALATFQVDPRGH